MMLYIRARAREVRKRYRHWLVFGRLPLRLTYIRMEVGCALRGHQWITHYEKGYASTYCDRCFRVID